MRFKKNYLTIKGRQYAYWQKNPQEARTIVLLHGFPGNHAGLLELASAFKNYHLIIPDLPGCGESEQLIKKHLLKHYAVWLKIFLEQLAVEQPIIIGHSFGARLAMYFSRKHPDLVDKLVLITPVIKVDGIIARMAAVEYQIAGVLPKYLKKPWLNNRFYRQATNLIIYKTSGKKRRKMLQAAATQELARLDPQVSIEVFDDFHRSNWSAIAKHVHVKTLVIAADKDEIAPLATVKDLAFTLPRSELKIMVGAGHIVVGEQPLATARLINNWLSLD